MSNIDIGELFGFGDDAAPYTKGSQTSKDAAQAIAKDAGNLRQQVYNYIISCGVNGCTDNAGEHALGLKTDTYRPRRRELVKKGLVADSGRTAKTKSGRNAVLWVAQNSENQEELEEVAKLRAIQAKLKSQVGKMTQEQCAKVIHAIKGWNL